MDIPFVFILWKNTNELGGICQTVRGMSVESKQKERLVTGSPKSYGNCRVGCVN